MRLISCLLLFAAGLAPAFAAYQNIQWRNPTGTGADLYDVAVNPSSNLYAIVGEEGTIATSNDANQWQFQSTVTLETLRGVALSEAIALAVGDNGTVVKSTNGGVWSTISGQTANFRDIAYGAGMFVAVGELSGSSFLATSSDGEVWTVRDSGATAPLNSVAFLGSTFVAVGEFGAVTRSTGGVNWTATVITEGVNLVSVAPGLGQFIAVSNVSSGTRIFTSSSGASWSGSSAPSSVDGVVFSSISYANSNYVIAADQGYILTSGDASVWTPRFVQDNLDTTFTSVLGSTLGWNIVGKGGDIYFSFSGLIGWGRFGQGVQGNYNDIGESNGVYVVVGNDGSVGGSVNGTTWVNRSSNTTEDMNGVTFAGALSVMVGDAGSILVSLLDGDNWTSRSSPVSTELLAVANGSSRFYAVGKDGAIVVSTDANAVTWTSVTSPTTDDIVSIEFLNTRFLAGTSSGGILLNTGGSWSTVFSGASGSVNGFTYFLDKYWAVATSGSTSTIYSSEDAETWVSVQAFDNASISSLASANGWITGISPEGNVLSSDDGEKWTLDIGVLSSGLSALRPINNQFLATGSFGKIAVLEIGVAVNVYFGPLTDFGNGWVGSSWLGNFNIISYPTIYHEEQGWWFCTGQGMEDGDNSYWIYDTQLGWLWTAEGTYPWVYVNAQSTWAFFGGTNNGFRSFFFNNTQTWQFFPLS
ncbi:hypothetical protein [Rubellicoccus peritrichatus]|uniref:Photosynthesis system II assembly factor Ycf48/Hcf136-like domain-containing protein n=1 Tax=Rubellicoccus peritrichatus TaxID=3080537 RepID=A0AAQ3LDG1_9BACT|nr:hypothetical protein [Puniceicoccus sp. CR14]WOO42414.1 hypothetical protein RZN69_04880 [Puniceicoccus sp. CR14]